MASMARRWAARAEDYRHLWKAARNNEVRQVLDHLARVCVDMANVMGGGTRNSAGAITDEISTVANLGMERHGSRAFAKSQELFPA